MPNSSCLRGQNLSNHKLYTVAAQYDYWLRYCQYVWADDEANLWRTREIL